MRSLQFILISTLACSALAESNNFDFRQKKPIFVNKETIFELSCACILSSLLGSYGEAKTLSKIMTTATPQKMILKFLSSWSLLTAGRIAKLYCTSKGINYWFKKHKEQA